mmetsp:Transcript_29204/g.73206  ORF Transcript_29204/g.73206 Transcript_29204/m.73206 type:complete len:285 (-) Transcript_29204:222-1076(-)
MPLPGYGLHAKDEPIHGAEAEVATGRKLRLAALGGDAAAALGASLVVSPFILAVDKAIVQNAAGSDSLLGSLRKTAAETLLRPVALLRRPELYFIWGVYSATYFAANAIDTVCESRGADPAMPKFLGATCVNMGAGIAKDRALARMFGSSAPRAMPLACFGMFAARDAVTIFASFTLPERVAALLQQAPGSGSALNLGLDRQTAGVSSQVLLPMAVQLASTPFHLAGLDLYNNPGRAAGARAAYIASTYPASTLARMGRICPAFGIGGLGNKYLRARARRALHS